MINLRAPICVADLPPPRDLPIALAHELARTKFGNAARLELLNRIFSSMIVRDKIRCREELRLCLDAKRGNSLAEVS